MNEPSRYFQDHLLAIAECYVRLVEASRVPDGLRLERFQPEPGAWRTFARLVGGLETLKPDGYLELSLGDVFVSAFLEVDRGMESPSAVRRQLDAYLRHARTGQEQRRLGVYPMTFWLTVSEKRASVLRATIDNLPMPGPRFFVVGLLDRVTEVLSDFARDDSSPSGLA